MCPNRASFEVITIYGLLRLPSQEALPMAHGRCTEVQARPPACLACTSGTLDALPRLVPPCAAAVQAQRRAWRRAGAPRTARPLSVDQTGPLPTPAERRCFLRTSLKPSALPVGQGRVGGLGHSQAPPWRHGLLPALLAARRALGAAPARALPARAPRRRVSAGATAP